MTNGDFFVRNKIPLFNIPNVPRYEMDMLLGSVSSAIKHVEILPEKINNNTISTDTICIEKHLSRKSLVCNKSSVAIFLVVCANNFVYDCIL